MKSSDENDDTAAGLRLALVDELIAKGLVRSPRVEAAFRAVPRHVFVPHVPLVEAYADQAIANKVEDGVWVSSSSQPAIMAIMLEQLDLRPGMRVLEIGAGTGYNAALMAHIAGPAGQVISIDIDPQVCAGARQRLDAAGFPQVAVICADGGYGWPPAAPYDRIILTVGAPDLLPEWRRQLKDGGRLVLPLKIIAGQKAIAFERQGELLVSREVTDCGFMELRGAFAEGEEVEQPVGPVPGLSLRTRGRPPVLPERIFDLLQAGESQAWDSGLAVSGEDLFGGLRLWLGLHTGDLLNLHAEGPAAEQGLLPPLYGLSGERPFNLTAGLAGENGLALLARPEGAVLPGSFADLYESRETFPLRVVQYGPDPGPARRLLDLLQGWASAGRPGSDTLRVRAWPAETQPDPEPGELLLPTRYAWLGLAWKSKKSGTTDEHG